MGSLAAIPDFGSPIGSGVRFAIYFAGVKGHWHKLQIDARLTLDPLRSPWIDCGKYSKTA
jgi:hypothetical protein